MSLKRVLLPGEAVLHHVPPGVSGLAFDIAVTERRLLFYRAGGIFGQNDNVESYPRGDVLNVGYFERGMVFRKGTLTLDLRGRPQPLVIEGKPAWLQPLSNALSQPMA